MTTTAVRRLSVALALAAAGCSVFAADVIQLSQPRPMMILVGQLFDRYRYMVTYEDGPTDPAREVVVDKGPLGPVGVKPAWLPVTFHVQAIDEPAAGAGQTGASARGRDAGESLRRVKPLGPDILEPLMEEYNQSGNPGRFKVIYDGDYAHVVQTQRMIGGKLVAFEPILSTVVPVAKSTGICDDVLAGLWGELQQARGIHGVMEAGVPVAQLASLQCIVDGHDIPARQVLIQVLDQLDLHPRTHERVARFIWTFVYEPTTDKYFLSTRVVPTPGAADGAPKK